MKEYTVAFLSLGCKVNSYETEAMREMFEAEGYQTVKFKDIADVYVVNTCTVTNMADHKSRQMLHQAKKRNPEAIIAAVGCYVQAAEEALLEDRSVDIVVGNNKKSDIVALVERFRESNKKEELIVDMNLEREYETLSVSATADKTRAFIKIQDGCNRFCSYCIIPYVRGRARSREEEEILSEVTELSKKGYKEIVFTGIHISSYGFDLKSGEDNDSHRMPLVELITKVSKIDGIIRIRLGSLEPGIVTREFVKAIAEVDSFCPHFHLSLQSGSNSTLQKMNRKYSTEQFYEKTLLIKEFFDNPAFTTDVIVGFPGETGEDFEMTKQFVQKVGFSDIHVFKYSKRAGTKAADMPDQIAEEIKNSRSIELISIANQMSKEYKATFLGRIEKILLEENITIEGNTYQVGHNERYLKLAILSIEDESNQIINARVCSDLTKEIMLCKIID